MEQLTIKVCKNQLKLRLYRRLIIILSLKKKKKNILLCLLTVFKDQNMLYSSSLSMYEDTEASQIGTSLNIVSHITYMNMKEILAFYVLSRHHRNGY